MKALKVLYLMLVVVGLIFTQVGANAVGYQTWWEEMFNSDTGAWTPVQFSGGGSLGQTFAAATPFTGVRIYSPSWSGTGAGFTSQLYKWNTDYTTTLAGPMIAVATFTNYADNGAQDLVFDTAAEPGQYLLHTCNPVWGTSPETGAPGHWGWSGSSFYADPVPAGYQNGIIMESMLNFKIGIRHAEARPYTEVENFFTGGADGAISLASYPKIGQRFTATQPFDGVEVNSPAWSSNGVKGFTLKLWTWATDYATTVAQTPIATNTYTGTIDNAWYAVVSATLLQPGVYFWEMSDPTSTTADLNVGMWWNSVSAYSGGEAYLNGVAQGSTSTTWSNPFSGGSWTAVQFGAYTSLGQTFETTEPIYGIGMNSPSWSGVGAQYRMTLYEWNTDYGTSTGGTALYQQTFVNYADNTTNKIVFTSPIPVGQYLLVTDEPTTTGNGVPGHWAWQNSPMNTGADVPNAYFEGYKGTDYDMNYLFNIAYGHLLSDPAGPDFLSRSVLKDTTAVMDWTQY